MILDALLQFSNAQDLSSGTDTGVLSTYSVDLQKASQDLGAGIPLFILVMVTTAFEGSGDTLDVEYVSDSTADLATSLSVHRVLGTFAAESAAGTRILAPVPVVDNAMERYFGLRYYARGSGALTAGAVDAFIVKDPYQYYSHPNGYTIS